MCLAAKHHVRNINISNKQRFKPTYSAHKRIFLVWRTYHDLFNIFLAGVCGMESGAITDSQLSQSDYEDFAHTETIEFKHQYARFNNPDLCWSPDTGNFPSIWIQVDFLNPVKITGLVTQGSSPEYDTCVTGLYIETGNTESSLAKLTHNGSPQYGVIMFIIGRLRKSLYAIILHTSYSEFSIVIHCNEL